MLDEFLKPLGTSQNALARTAKAPLCHINEIVLGMRSITADTAVGLAATLGTGERFWLGLRADYDPEQAHLKLGAAVDNIEWLTARANRASKSAFSSRKLL